MPFLFLLLHRVDQLLCIDLQHPSLYVHRNKNIIIQSYITLNRILPY
jgi:hypothetical protein